MKKVECPSCLGQGNYMKAKSTRGFEYKDCNLCNSTGNVEPQIADDYIFAMTEDNFDDD